MRKTIFKGAAFILMIIMAAMFMAGCLTKPDDLDDITGGDADYEVNINLPLNTEGTLRLLIPNSKSEEDMLQPAIDAFLSKYLNVEIEIDYVALSSYGDTIIRQHQAGNLPDIVWSNSPEFLFLIGKKLALNLNPYIKASEEAGIFNVKDDFVEEFFDLGKHGSGQYMVPRSVDSVVTFINTQLLAQAGVELGTENSLVKNGWTWDDFMEVCAQVRSYLDANGRTEEYVLDANITWEAVMYPILKSFGANVFDAEGNVAIDSEETEAALALIREMVVKKYIVDTTKTSGSSYESGTSAMLFQSSAISLYERKPLLSGKVDIVTFPYITENNTPKVGSGIAGYTINSTSKNRDLAWAFLTFLLSYDGQNLLAEGGLNLPSIRNDLSDYTTAKWGEGYRSKNLSAYTFSKEYQQPTNFMVNHDPGKASDLILAMSNMMSGAANSTRNIGEVIQICVRDMQDALV